jgi:hypothetical protein
MPTTIQYAPGKNVVLAHAGDIDIFDHVRFEPRSKINRQLMRWVCCRYWQRARAAVIVVTDEPFVRREALLLCPSSLPGLLQADPALQSLYANPKIGSRFSDRKHRAHGEHNESFLRILRIL